MCHSGGTSLLLPRRRLWDDLPKVVDGGALPPAIFDPRKRPDDPNQGVPEDPRNRGGDDPRGGGRPDDPRKGGRPDDPRTGGRPDDPRTGGTPDDPRTPPDDPRTKGEDPPVAATPVDPRTKGTTRPVPVDPRTGGVDVASDVPRAPLTLVPAMAYLSGRDPGLAQALRLSA